MPDLIQYRKIIDRNLASFRLAKQQFTDEKNRLTEAKQAVEDILESQKILQGSAETIQQQAHRQIARVVTRCLKAVFGENAYEFQIDFRQSRGKTEARLSFVRDGLEVDPLDACGGGVVDVAAFALRLACLILTRPKRRRLLILDEPWKHLSANYRPAVRELVEMLAEEMGIQFIIVTHSDEFRMGRIIEIDGDS